MRSNPSEESLGASSSFVSPSYFVPLQRSLKKRRGQRGGTLDAFRVIIMGFFLLDRVEYKNVLVWIATYHYVPLHASILAILLNCILHIFFFVIFPLLQEASARAITDGNRDTYVHNTSSEVYKVVTHAGVIFGVGVVGYKLMSAVTDAMIDSCLVVHDSATNLTVGFYGLLYDYRIIFSSRPARFVFAAVTLILFGCIVSIFFCNILVNWEPNDGVVFRAYLAVLCAVVIGEARSYRVNVVKGGTVPATTQSVTVWWRKAVPRARWYIINVLIILSAYATYRRTAMYGLCCFCEGMLYMNVTHIVISVSAKMTLLILSMVTTVKYAMEIPPVRRMYAFVALPWFALSLSTVFCFPPIMALFHLPPVVILMNSISAYVTAEKTARERRQRKLQEKRYEFPKFPPPDTTSTTSEGSHHTRELSADATDTPPNPRKDSLENSREVVGQGFPASYNEKSGGSPSKLDDSQEFRSPNANGASPLPPMTDSHTPLSDISMVSLALRLYLCHWKIRNNQVPHYNASLMFRSVHRILITISIAITLILGIWVSVLNPTMERESPTSCVASPDGNQIRVKARYMVADLYGLNAYPTDPRSLVYESDQSVYDLNRNQGLCSRKWGDLHAGDLAYFSLMAYLKPNSTDFKAMLDFYRRFRLDAGDWVTLPTNHTYGRAVFRHLYSASKNTSVIAVRGTDVVEPFDFLQNILLFGETFIFKILSLILPLSSFIPERVIVDFVAAANAISALCVGVDPHQNYYHLQIEDYLQHVKSETVIITGHSLGGVIAHIVAARRGFQGVAFSSPGVNLMRKKLGILPDRIDAYTTNVLVSNDFTVAVHQPEGSVHHIQCEHKSAEVCHSIELHVIRMWTVCQQYRALTRLNGTYQLTNHNG